MNKKLFAAVLALVCIGVLVAGTAAYKTTSGTAKSQITASNLKVELVMTEEDEEGNSKEVSGEFTVVPGEVLNRTARAVNKGDQPLWARIKYPTDMEGLEAGGEGWIYSDGYMYYEKALEPGETSAPLDIYVHIDGGLGNESAGKEMPLNIELEATQKAHNGDTVMDAKGWPGK